MTKKETIALRYYTALTEANGSSFNDSDVSYLASHRSAAWLEEKAAEAEKALEKKRFTDKKKAYFESEEGKAALETLKAMWDDHCEDVKNTEDAAEKVIEDYLNKLYGREDIMAKVCGDHLELGIKNTKETNYKDFKFGHSFTIYFNLEKYSFNKNKTEINFSTMGTYEPGVDTDYCFRMKLLGDFSMDLSLCEFCKTAIKDCVKVREDYAPISSATGAWKDDPFNNPKPWTLLAA
jgi:hypothetical protein